MSTELSSTSEKSKGPGVLTTADVTALFQLFAESVYGKGSQKQLAFTGPALAQLIEAYGEHLVFLMKAWPDLPRALKSPESTARARLLRRRLLDGLTKKSKVREEVFQYDLVEEPDAHQTRSLIGGKGLEI
jgi:hypothetical protein